MDLVEEFLEHHGVKGQKWGIRNQNNNLDRISRIQRSNSTIVSRKQKLLNTANKIDASIHKHPKTVASIVVGSAFAVSLLAKKGSVQIRRLAEASR